MLISAIIEHIYEESDFIYSCHFDFTEPGCEPEWEAPTKMFSIWPKAPKAKPTIQVWGS